MAAKGTKSTEGTREPKKQTPTFLLELPLVVDAAQAKRLRAHLEAGRQFYNAPLSLRQHRLQQMRADLAWQAARAVPRSQKQERQVAFSALREQYGFSEYGLHQAATRLRTAWIAEHLDAVLAQTLAIRAYRIKYARLIRRPVSSPNAQGADCQGNRYFVQLVLAGLPYHKPGHTVGTDTIGLDLGPSSIASVPQHGEARLEILGGELVPDEQAIRRLQRKMDRQRRAANPEHYDERGRPKKRGKQGLHWKQSRGYQTAHSH